MAAPGNEKVRREERLKGRKEERPSGSEMRQRPASHSEFEDGDVVNTREERLAAAR